MTCQSLCPEDEPLHFEVSDVRADTCTAAFIREAEAGNGDQVGGGICSASHTWVMPMLSMSHLWNLNLQATRVDRAQQS